MSRTLSQVIDDLQAAGEKIHGIRSKPEDQRSDNHVAELRAAIDQVNALEAERQAVAAVESHRAAAPKGGPDDGVLDGTAQLATAGSAFVRSEAFTARRGIESSPFGLDHATGLRMIEQGRSGYQLEQRQNHLLTSETSDPGAGNLLVVGGPLPPVPRQQTLRIRDLLTYVPMSLASMKYAREVDPEVYELGASAVAEAEEKPEARLLFEQKLATAETIAAWVAITRQMMEDSAMLGAYIDERLGYMVLLREEYELLNGTGTSPRLQGIFQEPGRQTQAFSTDAISSVGLGIGKVWNTGLAPDAVTMRPDSFWSIVTTRHANQFDNGFSTGVPNGAPDLRAWGLPVVLSQSVPVNKAMVGAWRLGGMFMDRQNLTIMTTDSHADYFIHNKLVVLAEERASVAWTRPDAFCEVDLVS